MDGNPYQSPAPVASRSSVGGLLLRLLAVGCWLAALLPVAGFLLIVNRPDNAARREANFPLYVAVCVAMFLLPSLELVMLGVASWWRVRWVAIAGAMAFAPIVLWSLAIVLWPR